MLFRRIKRQRKEKKSKSSAVSDDEDEFLPALAAVAGIASAGVSLYGAYKSVKTMANTDWAGMIGDVEDEFKENVQALRDRATTAFEKLDYGVTSTAKSFGQKASSLWEGVGDAVANTGFAGSGQEGYLSDKAMEDINRENRKLWEQKAIDEQMLTQDFEEKEYQMFSEKEAKIAELEAQNQSSKGWYPGKILGSIFG